MIASYLGESNFAASVALLAADWTLCEVCGRPIPTEDVEAYRDETGFERSLFGEGAVEPFPATCEPCAELEVRP